MSAALHPIGTRLERMCNARETIRLCQVRTKAELLTQLENLAAGCASTADGDRVNPPADHCVQTRPAIAIDAQGAARTVRECSLWYFGPSREQDTRFRRAGGL